MTQLILFRKKLAIALLLMISLGYFKPSYAQSPRTDLLGKSNSVIVVPNQTANAGEVKFKSDRDHDGMPDDAEAQNGTNPDDASDADGDADGDGLTNGDEVAGGTNVNNTDSDGDGVSDAEEVRLGYNPLDPNSTPPPNTTIVSISIAPSSLAISINPIFGQQPVQLMVIGVTNTNTTVNLTASPNTTYQSLNPAVALVDDFGQVAGLADGLATVEARYQNLTAQTSVNVATLTPRGLASLPIPGFANNVDVAGNFAYVAAGAAGLQVVNVSDHSNPSIVGALETPGNANDVRVVGNLAYLADGSAGLRIIDVSNPANPIERGAADTTGEAQDVFVVANRAYVADGPAGLQIIDISNPAAPAILGTADTPGTARGVAVAGNLAVVADEGNAGGGGGGGDNTAPVRNAKPAALNSSSAANAAQVIDVTNPAAPQIVGCVTLPGEAKDLVARNSLAYVATFAGGMYVVDFSNPTAPFIAGSLPFGSPGGFVPRDLELAGDFVFAAEQLFVNAVPIVDVGNPFTPQFRGVIDFAPLGDYNGTGIALDAQFVYMTGESFIGPDNGVNGDTRLFIGQYQSPPPTQDNNGLAPVVSLVSPQNGQTVVAGSALTLAANAADDIYVAGVRFTVNGTTVATDSAPPYQFSYPVPANATSLSVSAAAFDLAGNTATAGPVTVTVIPDPAPVVVITSPPPDTTLISGQSVEFAATATDEGGLQAVRFFLNGAEFLPALTDAYQLTTVVPANVTTLTFEAEARDNLSQVTRVSRIFPVIPDAGTTVTGRVTGPDAQPLPNAAVSVFDEFTGTTGADGTFAISNVPTVRGDVVVRVSAVLGGQNAANSSLPAAPVRSGATDVGIIRLAVGPTAPTAFKVADYDGDFIPDVFVGYPDRQSLIYQFNAGTFTPGTSLSLPFGGVTSGAVIDGLPAPKLFVQLAGEPGKVREYALTGNNQPPASSKTGNSFPKNNSLSLSSVTVNNSQTLATGFSAESAFTAAIQDFNGINVLSFLSAPDANGNSLTVRFGNVSEPTQRQTVTAAPIINPTNAQPPGNTVFTPPSLLLQNAQPLRSLTLNDVTGDGLDDLLAVRPLSGGGANLVVLPRSGTTSFDAPLESPILTRTGIGAGASDYAVGLDFGVAGLNVGVINDRVRLYVLGDDRVRIYQGDNAQNFILSDNIILPLNQTPTGIVTGYINNDSLADVLVTVRDTNTGAKSLLVYQRAFDGSFQSPLIRTYTAPPNSGDTRMALGDWNQNGSIDVVVVDGDKVLLLVDVGPNTQSS